MNVFTIFGSRDHQHLTADDALTARDSLFALHGTPLVLKSDHGSAFIAEQTQTV